MWTSLFQNLVGAFVDTHHHLMVKVNSLEDEIEDKKRHVNLLKQELNDAVRREHEQVLITLFRPMEFSILKGIYIKSGWSIVYIQGSQVIISKKYCVSFSED